MKLASVLTPLSDENLTLAAQCGVDEVVARYLGPDLTMLGRLFAFGYIRGLMDATEI